MHTHLIICHIIVAMNNDRFHCISCFVNRDRVFTSVVCPYNVNAQLELQ